MYYVVKGHVLLYLSSPAGKQLAIDIAKPGDLIGFEALRKRSERNRFTASMLQR